MACTTDNASNNDTLINALEITCKEQNIAFTAYENHIRCLAHIINLSAQDALSTLKVGYLENEDEILINDGISEVIPKVRVIWKIQNYHKNYYSNHLLKTKQCDCT